MEFRSKDEIQDHAVALSSTYKNLILEWATAIGKSRAAIRIIERSDSFWYIVVAETNHILNWKLQFKEYGKEYLLNNVEFVCYASLHKVVNNNNYVFDEFHHIYSDRRIDTFKQILSVQKDKYNIGLSATLSRSQKELLNLLIPNHHIFKITVSQGVSWGLIPKPSVYLIPVDLENTVKSHIFNFSKNKQVKCTEKEMYEFITQRIDYFKKVYFDTRNEFDKTKWLAAGSQRKRFMSECKTKYAKVLIDKLKDKRFICFTGSIKQSEQLSKGLSIHNRIGKKLREDLITRFNNGEIDYIFSTNMLRESMNLNGIQAAIVVQVDNQEKNLIQQIGRAIRSSNPEIYILYLENSQDEHYIDVATEGLDRNLINYINLEDL